VSDVNGTLGVTLHDGDTTFELNRPHLENTITVNALANAATSLIVPVLPEYQGSDETVIAIHHQEDYEVEKLMECYHEHNLISTSWEQWRSLIGDGRWWGAIPAVQSQELVPYDGCGPAPVPVSPYNNTVIVNRGSFVALLVHSDVFRSNVDITGDGTALIQKDFTEDHDRQLVIGDPPESHVTISDHRTVDSTIRWERPGVVVKLEVKLHQGHSFFNLSQSQHTNIIDLTVKPGSTLTIVDPVKQSAEINGNVMVIDKAVEILVEFGGMVNTVPVDTMRLEGGALAVTERRTTGTYIFDDAFISLQVGPEPEVPVFEWFLAKEQCQWESVELYTKCITVDHSEASSDVNFTSPSTRVFVWTTDRLPSISAHGEGQALFHPTFYGEHTRHLLVGKTPSPQFTITDGLPSPWPQTTFTYDDPDVNGTVKVDLDHGDTDFQLDHTDLDHQMDVNVHENATIILGDATGAGEAPTDVSIGGDDVLLDDGLLVHYQAGGNTGAISPIVIDDSTTISITLDDAFRRDSRRSTPLTLWRFAKGGVYTGEIDMINITTSTKMILIYSIDKLPPVNLQGSGSCSIAVTFGINHKAKRELELRNPPLPQLSINYTDTYTAAAAWNSTIQWGAGVTVDWTINLQKASTAVEIQTTQLDTVPYITVDTDATASITSTQQTDQQVISLKHAYQNLPNVMSSGTTDACFNAMQQCSRSIWADEYVRKLEQGHCSDTEIQCGSQQVLVVIDTEHQLESMNKDESWNRVSIFDATITHNLDNYGVDTADTEHRLQCTKWQIDIPAYRQVSDYTTYPIIFLFVTSVLYAILRFILFHEVSVQSLYCLTVLTVLPILQHDPLPLYMRAMTQAADVIMSDWWYMLDYVDCDGQYGYYEGLLATSFIAVMLLAASWYKLADRDKRSYHVVYCCAAHRPEAPILQQIQRNVAYAMLEKMKPKERKAAIAGMSPVEQAGTIASMESEEQEAVLAAMSAHEQAQAVGAMSHQQREVALAAIGSEKQAVVLAAMSVSMRQASLEAIPVFRRQDALQAMQELRAARPDEFPVDHADADADSDSAPITSAIMTMPVLGLSMKPDLEPGEDGEITQRSNPLWGMDVNAMSVDEEAEQKPLTPPVSPKSGSSSCCSKKCLKACCKCSECCNSCLRATFEGTNDGELQEIVRVFNKEGASANGALRCLLERMSFQERTQLFATMRPEEQAAVLAALGPEDSTTQLSTLPLEEQAVVLSVMSSDARIVALNAMKNEDEKDELLSWRICAGCVLSGLSFVYALWLITAGVAHTPRLVDNVRDSATELYAGFFISVLSLTSLYIFWCTLWPLLTAARKEYDPQGQAVFAASHKILLIGSIIFFGVWRKVNQHDRPEQAVASVLAILEGAFALLDFLTRRCAYPAHDCGQAHNGWRLALVLCTVFGHLSGIGLVFSVYGETEETVMIMFFLSYWFFTCASETVVYLIGLVIELRVTGSDRRLSFSENLWNLSIHLNLRSRLVSMLWVMLLTLCLMTIRSRLHSVIAVCILVVLGWMYQYVHHCLEYRSQLSRVHEVDWVKYPDTDDEEQPLNQQVDRPSEVELDTTSFHMQKLQHNNNNRSFGYLDEQSVGSPVYNNETALRSSFHHLEQPVHMETEMNTLNATSQKLDTNPEVPA
jgi:hypothetical protein